MTEEEMRARVRSRIDDIRNDPQVMRSSLWDRITEEVVRIMGNERKCKCEDGEDGCTCRKG